MDEKFPTISEFYRILGGLSRSDIDFWYLKKFFPLVFYKKYLNHLSRDKIYKVYSYLYLGIVAILLA